MSVPVKNFFTQVLAGNRVIHLVEELVRIVEENLNARLYVLEVVILGLLAYGVFIFLRAIENLKQGFKEPIWFLIFSLIINVFLGVMIIIFLTYKVDYGSKLWIIHPVFGLLAASLLVLGGKKFFSAIEREE